MERLQAAIEKARAARREGPAAGGASGAASPNGEAWRALKSLAPDPRHLERGRIVSGIEGHRGGIGIDKLRTRLARRMQAEGWRRLAVTSPGPGCGKSTLALNLAFSLARRPEERVALCEMDLRHPSLAGLLGVRDAGRDFSRVLSGVSGFEAEGLRIGRNLALGLASAPRPDAAELLQGSSTPLALERIEATYATSYVLFDTPPVLLSDDTAGLLKHVDCALIVAAAGVTTMAEIDRCEREVAAQSDVVGIVLNKCRFPERGQRG